MALRLSLSSLLLLLGFLQVSGLYRGPGPRPFLRSKRANSFLLEEILQGNLERECLEEVCSYEEAREVFEDHHQTARFWAQYYDGDQCESAPCANGGNCTDGVGGFYCTCPAPFFGKTCELGPQSRPKPDSDSDHGLDLASLQKGPEGCQTSGPASCEQLCTASDFRVSCSCLSGFRLKSDGRHCEPHVEFPCGQIPDQLLINSSHSLCTNHRCPWQVSVLDRRGVQLCWGALLGHNVVLTSAHCLQSQLGPDLDPNQIFIRLIGQRRALHVSSVDVHERFSLARHDYDLALLHTARPLRLGPTLLHLCVPAHRDHAENVLMHAGKQLLVGSHRSGTRSVTLEACRQNPLSHGLSNKMFCLETWTAPGLDQETTETASGLDQDQETTRTASGLDQDQETTRTALGLDQDHRKPEPELAQDQTRDHRLDHRPGQRPDHRPSTDTADGRQNGRNRRSDSQHQTEPDVDQTRTRSQTRDQTTDQDQSHDPRTESRSRKAQSNKDHTEKQNGRHQDHDEGRQMKQYTNQTGLDQNKHKVHLDQDQPGLNQDQPGLNQDQPGLNQGPPRSNQDLNQGPPRSNQDLNQGPPRSNQDPNQGPPRSNQDPNQGPPRSNQDQPGLNQDQPGLNQDLPRSNQDLNQDRPRSNQDPPGLNQDPDKPPKAKPNQDQMLVDPLLSSAGGDQVQVDPVAQIPNQTGPDHHRSKPVQHPQQGRPQGPSRPRVRGLFPGAPVVSVDRGTAYLVGLLTSTAPAGGSTHVLVFTKLSRHMSWLQRHLGHTTPPQTGPRS